ncbi:hypothetical protein [Bradyrhizobium lablabi]|uniref:Transposase n=3 Tax=Bradyrhizobium TaxID=374 RepID=A0ABY0QG94_9BRAD|nr:hypothetical protein SAMN05444163_7722 [Bradyrhizobium ottawaense]SEE42212.1 hypothetical protein SAMN05444171_7412 [Bradyrhizobium lablabi]
MGRPSTFTDEIFETICERLENGEVLRATCANEEMPDRKHPQRVLRSRNTRPLALIVD